MAGGSHAGPRHGGRPPAGRGRRRGGSSPPADIFGDLTRHGIPRAPEGFQTRYRRSLAVVSVDDGFVAALKTGRTRMVAALDRFDGPDAVLAGGTRLRPDTVICATGYRRGLEAMVGHLGVLRPDGIPVHHAGAPEHPAAPRLYFVGFWTSNGGQIRLMPIQARRVARAAARDRARWRSGPDEGGEVSGDTRGLVDRHHRTFGHDRVVVGG